MVLVVGAHRHRRSVPTAYAPGRHDTVVGHRHIELRHRAAGENFGQTVIEDVRSEGSGARGTTSGEELRVCSQLKDALPVLEILRARIGRRDAALLFLIQWWLGILVAQSDFPVRDPVIGRNTSQWSSRWRSRRKNALILSQQAIISLYF